MSAEALLATEPVQNEPAESTYIEGIPAGNENMGNMQVKNMLEKNERLESVPIEGKQIESKQTESMQIENVQTESVRMENKTVLRIGKLHEQGARSGQQDCFGVSDVSLMQTHGLLAVVADGMGGLSDGERVSENAVETILDNFAMYQGVCTLEQQLLFLVMQAVESVNRLLGPSEYKKSGSTLAMGLIRDGFFSFLSVGDSRICLYRHGILLQLNREHVFRNKLALDAVNREIPLQEIYTNPRKSGLISFLGMGQLEYIDMPTEPIRLFPGDKLLLMSDGVYNALEEQELTMCLKEPPETAVMKMKQLIQEKAYTNQDNYTAVVIEIFNENEVIN